MNLKKMPFTENSLQLIFGHTCRANCSRLVAVGRKIHVDVLIMPYVPDFPSCTNVWFFRGVGEMDAPLDSSSFGRLELQRRFGAGADMQFVVNMPKMPPDGPIVHSHAMGDFLVGEALGQQFENLAFAG